MKKIFKTKAFTLIEILVTIAIFVSVMIVATNVTVQIIRAKSRNQAQLQVNQEARNILETITREARLAGGGNDTTKPVFSLAGNDLGSGYKDGVNLNLSNSISKLYKVINPGGGLPKTIDVTETVTETSSSQELVPLDIELLVDVSGSMIDTLVPGGGSLTKLEQERAALKIFVEEFKRTQETYGQNDIYRIGLLTYATNSKVINSVMDQTDFNKLQNDIDTIDIPADETMRGTNIGDALRQARINLDWSKNASKRDVETVIIIMSDGCSNGPMYVWPHETIPNEDWWDYELKGAVADITNLNWKISTIGFSDSNIDKVHENDNPADDYNRWYGHFCFDKTTLTKIVANDGKYYYKENIIDAYKDVVTDLIKTVEIPNPPSTAKLTTTKITIDDLRFSLQNANGQPFLNIELTLKTANYDNPGTKEWNKAITTVKTGISSRKYR